MKYEGEQARRVLELQLEDGSWGQFHTLTAAAREKNWLSTEMALRRLQVLGYTLEDACIQRAVKYMDACLRGDKCIPDGREKLHDWDAFTDMMLSTWIRRFTLENERANEVAQMWADVIGAAFKGEEYDHEAYCAAFAHALGHKPRGGRFVDFVSFYQVSLTAGCFDGETEKKVIRYILEHPQGVYYIYDRTLKQPPAVFASRETSRWLGAMELLARHPHAVDQLAFSRVWLEANCGEDGRWDLSSKAKDGVFLPLSDSWRKAELRKADCTARIRALLVKLRTEAEK